MKREDELSKLMEPLREIYVKFGPVEQSAMELLVIQYLRGEQQISPKKWRVFGPEHDEYIDKQPTRAFVK